MREIEVLEYPNRCGLTSALTLILSRLRERRLNPNLEWLQDRKQQHFAFKKDDYGIQNRAQKSTVNVVKEEDMSAKDREIFFRLLSEHMPEPKTELQYKNSFELLVAVILSAQATDKGVNKATEKLFPVANTPAQIVALGEESADYLKTLNYFRNKTKHILNMCQVLIEQHEGNVPSSREALEALPGVGRKNR